MTNPSTHPDAGHAVGACRPPALLALALRTLAAIDAAPQPALVAYVPTPAQRRLAVTAKRLGPEISIRELCRRAHVARGTVYRWRLCPAFRAWMARELLFYWFITGRFPAAPAPAPASA